MNVQIQPAGIEGGQRADIPNGPAAAAILSAGIGCFAVSLCGWLGDTIPAVGHFFIFYRPTGPLSGVTTTAIVAWLLVWFVLGRAWKNKSVPMGILNVVAFLFLIAGFLLSFPPIADLLRGK